MSNPETLVQAVGANTARDLAMPVEWRTIPAADAGLRWSELREWVWWLKDRYLLDHRVIPPCWYLHGPLVDLLSALRDHHRDQFHPMSKPAAAADWQVMFSRLEPRLREWTARDGCTGTEHRDDPPITWPIDPDRWAGHVQADIDARRAREAAQYRCAAAEG